MLPTSHGLLSSTLDVLEASMAAGRFNTIVTHLAGEASAALGFQELADRARRILALAPEGAFFAGAIMNFTPDAAAIQRLRRLRDLHVLEPEFPPFRKADVETLAVSQEETRLAWQRRYADALAVARKLPRQPPETSMVAEIGSTAAVLGDFGTVEQILRDEALRSGEAYAVRLVLAIEYARFQRASDAERVITSLTPPVEGWASIQLALGLAGRRPWAGYPYADY